MNSQNTKRRVFIGHGRSKLWIELQHFIEKRLGLACVEFNSESHAGNTIVGRLNEMLNVDLAFIVMTAEDEHADGKIYARSNVIHEIGLFQGRLGFQRAIILAEEGCEGFSNIHGLTVVPFIKNRISDIFEKVREVLDGIENVGQARGATLSTPSAVMYDFKIVTPRNNDVVDKTFEIAGSWNSLAGRPPLAVIMTKDEPSKKYWFHHEVEFDRHTWRSTDCDCAPDASHTVYIAVLGTNAEVLFNYYHAAGLENKNWVGIPKLPSDVNIYDSIQVHVKKKPRRRLI